MGGPLETGLTKFKLFNHSRETHEIFRVIKYKKKIKFDKIWGYQNGVYSQTGLQNFEAAKILKGSKMVASPK